MVIFVNELFARGGLFEFLALIFTSKQRKCENLYSVKYLLLIKIDEQVGLNILPANVIKKLLLLQDRQQHENTTTRRKNKNATILVPKNENRTLLF